MIMGESEYTGLFGEFIPQVLLVPNIPNLPKRMPLSRLAKLRILLHKCPVNLLVSFTRSSAPFPKNRAPKVMFPDVAQLVMKYKTQPLFRKEFNLVKHPFGNKSGLVGAD